MYTYRIWVGTIFILSTMSVNADIKLGDSDNDLGTLKTQYIWNPDNYYRSTGKTFNSNVVVGLLTQFKLY